MSKEQLDALEEQLRDLFMQATKERSHYYVASVVTNALQMLNEYRLLLVARGKQA